MAKQKKLAEGTEMKSLSRIMFMALLLVLAGGAILLVTWDIPAPLAQVEKVIPNDRFKK